MEKLNCYYIGAFPPGWGGVTIKNLDLYNALSKKKKIMKVDLHRITRGKSIVEMLKLVCAILDRRAMFIIGISTGKNTRKNFARLLYSANLPAMRRSIILVMGGTDDQRIATDMVYRKLMSNYKRVYVETNRMRENLVCSGMSNVDVYPNCRFKPNCVLNLKQRNGRLQCVYFSYIQPEKGAEMVLTAAEELPEVDFTFYGAIDEKYTDFTTKIEQLPNVRYNGIFKGNREEVYAELIQYDVLLFPTQWETEGVPGILVEAKIAGLAEIVTNKSHNAELVHDNVDGIVIKGNSCNEFVSAIQRLNTDNELLDLLKKASRESASFFYIENYIDKILEDLN